MSTVVEAVKVPVDGVLKPFVDTMFRSAPDSVFMGSILLAGLTQSYALFVFCMVMLQIAGINWGLGKFAAYVSPVTGGPEQDSCSYQIPSWTRFSFLELATVKAPFPSTGIFFLSSIIAFFLGATINTRKEMTELAKQYPEMNVRFPISILLSVVFLTSFVVWRITKGCDSLMGAFSSVFVGFIIGTLLLLLNLMIFGREGLNFAGIPLLVSRTDNGMPLYVCTDDTAE